MALIDKLRKRKDYGPADRPSRKDAFRDLVHGVSRLLYSLVYPFHVIKGMFVDVVRIVAGDSISRDMAQIIGGVLFFATPLAIFV